MASMAHCKLFSLAHPMMSPRLFRLVFNCWPPLLGAGIRVTHIATDWRECRVSMPLTLLNRNIMKAHFGGSLYAMTDPFYMMMLMGILGRDYLVWDAGAEITFVKPGRKRVNGHYFVTDDDLTQIYAATAQGDKHFHTFHTTLHDSDGLLIARVKKVVYVRKKKEPT